MFSGYNLKITEQSFKELIRNDDKDFDYYKNLGENHLKIKTNECKKELGNYILNGVVDGTKLENIWFPKIKADIFISHSHNDHSLVLALAGWLNHNFGLDCFIDSCVWGYVDELLENINKDFSEKRNENGHVIYNHEKCNRAASHVNMMLCMALQKMIDKTESIFVVNTENSIDEYSNVYEEATYSPWIYSEILFTELVRKRELSDYRDKKIFKSLNEKYAFSQDGEFKSIYQVSLNHMESITYDILCQWKKKWNQIHNKKSRYSLDELYKITNYDKMKNLIDIENILN